MEWPFLSFAEAGTRCDHEVDSCNWIHPHCAPYFQSQEFRLTGPPGGTARGVFPFVAGEGHNYGCQPSATADDAWLKARVQACENPWDWLLVLDADLTSLEPGTYTTNVHARALHVERCLPAVLIVETPARVESPDTATGFERSSQLRVSGPNPSSGSFELVYESKAPGPVRCAVYDAAGREVATIADTREQSAGQHTITWDGRGADGRPVMPGVYLVRVTTDAERKSGRVIVVR